MPPINILIKPASSKCNLACSYCFYHSLVGKRLTADYGVMSDDLLEEIIKKAFDFADGYCTFGFQGGEPTLAGLDFYRKFIELVKIYNTKNIPVNKSLQTNGIVINDKWAEFLSKNNFLVGLSLDGHKDFNDKFRQNVKGEGYFDRIIKTSELFNKYKVEYNILQVVTGDSAREAKLIYKFFKEKDFRYIQCIPCLDPLDMPRGKDKYSLKPKQYTRFLMKFFDCWYEDMIKGNFISVRFFDNILAILLNQPPESCDMKGHCSVQNVIESDGSIYPCDFYVLDKWKIGNIKNLSFWEVFKSPRAQLFVNESFGKSSRCRQCKWYTLCRGGCKRNKEGHINYYCETYQDFFKYSIDRFNEVLKICRPLLNELK